MNGQLRRLLAIFWNKHTVYLEEKGDQMTTKISKFVAIMRSSKGVFLKPY